MLRGLLFLPESQTKRPPLVIMAHGTSATVYMVADKYAEAFSRAGLAVLLYDHRNFGRSEGEPRQGTNPWIQCRGYRDAVKLVERLNGVDPSNANFDIIKGIISRGKVVGRVSWPGAGCALYARPAGQCADAVADSVSQE